MYQLAASPSASKRECRQCSSLVPESPRWPSPRKAWHPSTGSASCHRQLSESARRGARSVASSSRLPRSSPRSPDQKEVLIPGVSLSLTTRGGALFPVTQPFVLIVDEINGQVRAVGYCLAVLKSHISINIIGQNFMTGLKVVFDRKRSVPGWQKFDCYKNVRMADAPEGSPSPAPGPMAAHLKPHVGRPAFGGVSFSLTLLLLHLLVAAAV